VRKSESHSDDGDEQREKVDEQKNIEISNRYRCSPFVVSCRQEKGSARKYERMMSITKTKEVANRVKR